MNGDLDSLEQRLDLRSQALEDRFRATIRSDLQAALTAQARQLVLMFVATTLPLIALALVVGRPT